MKKIITLILIFIALFGNAQQDTTQSNWRGSINHWLAQGGKDPKTLGLLLNRIPIGYSNNAWGLNGNYGTSPGYNYLGTADGVPFMISAGQPFMGSNTSLIYLQSNIGSSSGELYIWQPNQYYDIQSYIDMNSEYAQFSTTNTNGNNGMYLTETPTAINITSQQQQGLFEVDAAFKLNNGTQAAGYVLVSDADGVGTWQTPSGGIGTNWGIGGNTGTNSATNFIGTTDNQRLNIKTNDALRYSIGNTPRTIIAYQDSFFALYRTPSLKVTADAYQFMTATTFSWFDSVAANNVAYLTTGVDNFAYSTGDIFGVSNNYHSDIVDRHYGNKRDVMLSIDKTPHKRVQVEAFDNNVSDTISGNVEMSIYDPTAGHDVISLQIFKPHASGDIKTSFYDTARAVAIIKDETGARGIISESYLNADSINYSGLKKIVFNNDIRIVNGSQGKNKVAISDNNGTISFQTLAALLSLVVSYSDDTAAASGGLSIGDTYYNTTTKAYTRRTI